MNLWKPLQPSKSGTSTPTSSWNTRSTSPYNPPTVPPPSGGGLTVSSFKPLVPSRSHGRSASITTPTTASTSTANSVLPPAILAKVFAYIGVPDVPSWAGTCRAFAKVASEGDGEGWKAKWEAVREDSSGKHEEVVTVVDATKEVQSTQHPVQPPASSFAISDEDDFGDFSSHSLTKLALSEDDVVGIPSQPNDVLDDGFGEFTGTTTGKSANGMTGSLLDLDFEEQDVPLPSSPTTARKSSATGGAAGASSHHARRTSGFFGLSEKGLANLSKVASSVASTGGRPHGQTYLSLYKAHHLAMLPLCRMIRSNASASSSSHLLSSLSATLPTGDDASIGPTLEQQAALLTRLLRFLSGAVQPTRDWGWLRSTVVRGGVADRFEGLCLGVFEKAEERMARRKHVEPSAIRDAEDAGDVQRMKEAAMASWRVYSAANSGKDADVSTRATKSGRNAEEARRAAKRKLAEEWELARVWIEKRELFYENNKWDSGANIVKIPAPSGTGTTQILDFTPMSKFVDHILDAVRRDGAKAMEIFPAEAGVLVGFVDRIGMDVVAEYINPLLAQTRLSPSQDLFLTAAAACFAQAWRLVDVTVDVYRAAVAKSTEKVGLDEVELRLEMEAVIYRLFESNMDEYLDEEVDWVKGRLEKICGEWNKKLGTSATTAGTADTTFLSSANPDQVKRNVLASFKDVLLLPVTIVPLTVNALVTGGTQAVNGLSMLNPQRWANQGATAVPTAAAKDGEASEVVFAIPETGDVNEKAVQSGWDTEETAAPTSLMAPEEAPTPWGEEPPALQQPQEELPSTEVTTAPKMSSAFDKLQLLVSLDTALELIHADRESLKRVEAFRGYQGKYGQKVQDALEEVFILLLQAIGNMHIAPGFRRAIEQMGTYQPAQHEETTSVAPLLQFFELVHVGDTIQSMVQVYFDKELSSYVDRTDFLNGVMQEKKRFEATLDDSVAGGLNAGIQVLMNQVEHIIQTRTKPGEYCPAPGTPMELGPTKGCQDAISCLEMHCDLLRGSTSKEVLEVFYQEVGIRLQTILQKHMKRQIISLEGGFQMIADLNAYHNFVASLKQQRITDEFSSLKMLGHVYIVSDAKDLAQIIRDVTRYGGGFRPEDVYEFIQRRSDWKKIEKTVDKSMYALSVREDCIIM